MRHVLFALLAVGGLSLVGSAASAHDPWHNHGHQGQAIAVQHRGHIDVLEPHRGHYDVIHTPVPAYQTYRQSYAPTYSNYQTYYPNYQTNYYPAYPTYSQPRTSFYYNNNRGLSIGFGY